MALDTTIGGASADSYGTLAEYLAYVDDQGLTASGCDKEDEQDLRKATVILDRDNEYKGLRQYKVQIREFPRVWMGLINGYEIDPDTIPLDIKHAQFELAVLLRGGLNPHATIEGAVKIERVKAGPVESETEYAGSLGRPRLVALEGLLRPYLIAGHGQQRLVRG